MGDATHTDHDQILKSLPQEVRDEYTLLKNHDDAHVFVQTDENGKVISKPMNREASARAIGFVNPNLKPGEAPYLNSEDLKVRKEATLKPGADPAQVLQSLKQIPKLKLTAGQKTLMDELESKSKTNNSREAFARLQQIQDVGKPSGFKYDMTVKSKSGNSLQFTFSNLPKDDPAYGATFYVPEDATPEQIKTRAVQIAKEFREGKTPQYIREGLPKIERASSAPPKEPPPAGTAQKTAPAAAETTAAPAQEGVKEPWQYTQKEWLAIVKKEYGMQGFPDLKAIETTRANHKAEVGQAIKDGEIAARSPSRLSRFEALSLPEASISHRNPEHRP